MRIFKKNNWLSSGDAAVFKVKRTLILNNVQKEFYHEDVDKEDQIVSATLHKDTNEITITVNIDDFLKELNK